MRVEANEGGGSCLDSSDIENSAPVIDLYLF